MNPTPITADEVRFIKLGEKGRWEKECIEGLEPCIRLGFATGHHAESLAGNWKVLTDYWRDVEGKTPGKTTEFLNQVRAFYTLGESTLWITFYKRKLYWCRARPTVTELKDGSRIRRVIGDWSSKDLTGRELHVDNLSGALTKVQGFRGTICKVEAADYLIKKLNGEVQPEVAKAERALNELECALVPLIRRLGWKDFELLTDLVFTQAGWQRIGSLGKTEKSIDLDLMSPVTGKRAFVQVKSQANLKTFLQYKESFEGMDQYDEMYFVVHTPAADLAAHHEDSAIELVTVERLAKLVVSAGVTRWVLRKLS
jgi:hypothetical protein